MAASALTTAVPLRRTGRPPGQPKTGGRIKGTPNKINAAVRERIEQEADPIGFLCRIVRGDPVPYPDGEMVRPALEHRVDAAKVLARKLVPDAHHLELLGLGENQPVAVMIRLGADDDD
jgi:hypothetical protein